MGKVNARVQHSLIRLKPEPDKRHAGNPRNGDNHTGGGNEPPGGTDVEARVAILESHIEYIRRDLDSVATDVRALRKEMGNDFTVVGEEFKDVRKEMRDEFKDVRKEMREDFRILFSALVALALGMAGMMAKGFGWL